ncbi:hypothetical protein TanjilG_28711, partial [Lupinus angustifolius]
DERASGSPFSSKKGKKSSSKKPKHRGLGVVQLEKIRLHSQIYCDGYQHIFIHSPHHSKFNNDDPRRQIACSSIPASSFHTSYSPPYGFQPKIAKVYLNTKNQTSNREILNQTTLPNNISTMAEMFLQLVLCMIKQVVKQDTIYTRLHNGKAISIAEY